MSVNNAALSGPSIQTLGLFTLTNSEQGNAQTASERTRMPTKRVEVGDGRDSAFSRTYAENEGSIYPLLVPVLETYVRTRCPHTEKGAVTLHDGDLLCQSCSEEVLTNLRKAVGSGDIKWSEGAEGDLTNIANTIPLAAVAIWARHGLDRSEEATREIGLMISDVCDVIEIAVRVMQLGESVK